MSNPKTSNEYKPRLLIVDDEKDMGDFAAFAGTSVGYDVLAVTSGGQFKEAYLAYEPDLVLMDIAMPDIDGIALIEWLRDAGNDAPIILMSGYGDYMMSWAGSVAEDVGMQIIDRISKPFSLEELESLLSGYLEKL